MMIFPTGRKAEGDGSTDTWKQVRDEVFGPSGVCCAIIEYPTTDDGQRIEPPTDPPEGMARAVYCYRHERWMSLPKGSIVLLVPEEKKIDLTGGVYD